MNDEKTFRIAKRAKVTDIASAETNQASDNFSAPHVSMTFNVDPVWHSRFKIEAAIRGISMKELFLECVDLYLKQKQKDRS